MVRAITKFDIQDYAFIQNITDVTVSYYLYEAGEKTMNIDLVYLSKSFDEFVETGDSYGFTTGATISSVSSPVSGSPKWFNYSVPASQVEGYLNNTITNHGFMLNTLENGPPSYIYHKFRSREYSDQQYRPKMTIIYDMPLYAQVISPASSACLRPDSTYKILWGSNSTGPYTIELLKGGGVVDTIASSVNESSYDWAVEKNTYTGAADYSIRVSDGNVISSNDPQFEIIEFVPVLTVNSGNGSGSHATSSTVSISGNNPDPSSKEFIAWRGDVESVDDTLSENTTLIMPNEDITITAVYDFSALPIPGKLEAENYQNCEGFWAEGDAGFGTTKVVGNGLSPDSTGFWISYRVSVPQAGSYSMDVRVAQMSLQAIMRVECVESQSVIGRFNLNGSQSDWYALETHNESIALPQGDYTLRFYVYYVSGSGWFNLDYLNFTYKGVANVLSVQNGSGSGSYSAGEQVAITANDPAEGKVFLKWTGDTSYIDDVNSATATVTMPGSSITLTAIYDDAVAVESFKNNNPRALALTRAGNMLMLAVPPGATGSTDLSIKLFNARGRLISTVAKGQFKAGYHQLSLKNSNGSVASGYYLCVLKAGVSKKVLPILIDP